MCFCVKLLSLQQLVCSLSSQKLCCSNFDAAPAEDLATSLDNQIQAFEKHASAHQDVLTATQTYYEVSLRKGVTLFLWDLGFWFSLLLPINR